MHAQVTNKLYHLTCISEHVEQFATDMLLTAVNSETNLSQTGPGPIAEGISEVIAYSLVW